MVKPSKTEYRALKVILSALLLTSLSLTVAVTPAHSLTRTKSVYDRVYEQDFRDLSDLKSVQQKLQDFFNRYHVQIILDDHPSAHIWDGLEPSDLPSVTRFAAILKSAWSKYPQDWVASSGLKTIRLVKNLRAVGYPKKAVPYNEQESMLYDAVALWGSTFQIEQIEDEQIVHHEFYHYIEMHKFHTFYYADPQWLAANEPDFRYGQGGNSAYADQNFYNKDHAVNGFVDTYATFAIEEDRAETYAWLMTPSKAFNLSQWTKTDTVLSTKVQLMKRYILETSPEMDEAFFSAITIAR